MFSFKCVLCFVVGLVMLATHAAAVGREQVKYQPNWESLEQRPLPSWYDEAKFGIFMHWGVFSVPSFKGAWFWWYWKSTKVPAIVDFMNKNYPPGFTYADFAPMFKAEFYDPNHWADIIAASGAKYVVLTTKHHEGFSNWPSKVSWNWNSMDVGPRRDLVGDLASAIRNRTKVHLGLYHSLFEWFNPLYLMDKANKFKTQSYVKEKVVPALYDLVTSYKPDVLWSDGDWEAPDTYWNSTHFLAWLYNSSPVKDRVVVNDRWGKGTMCHHGGYLTCQDRYNPRVLQNRKWENAMTVDKKAWGYRRELNMADIFSMDDLVKVLVETVSCGGNLLMNVGPTADGRIVPIFEERLRQMGQWLKVNGAAIYSTKPWLHQNDTLNPHVWYTSKKTPAGTTVYAITLKWPQDILTLGDVIPNANTRVTLLGHQGVFQFSARPSGGMDVNVADVSDLPCQWGWVFQLDNVTSRTKSTTLKWSSLRGANSIIYN